MKKQEYLKIVDELNFDKNEYCIISGGCMLMYGLREETNDVDLRITEKLFKTIKDKYVLKTSDKYPNLYELNDKVELKVENFDSSDVVYIDNYPVSSIYVEQLWKLKMNRDKDKRDLELIENYLNNK